jgi:hypothetical protein
MAKSSVGISHNVDSTQSMGAPELLTLYVPGVPEWDAECTSTRISSNPFGICISVLRDGLRE